VRASHGALLVVVVAGVVAVVLFSGGPSAEETATGPETKESAPPRPSRTPPAPRRRVHAEEPPIDAAADVTAVWDAAVALHRAGKSVEALQSLIAWRRDRPDFFAESSRAALLQEMEKAALAALSRASRSAAIEEVRALAADLREAILDPSLRAQIDDLVAAAERRIAAAQPGVGGDIVERAVVLTDKEAIARHLQRFAGMGPAPKKKEWVDEQLARLEQANQAATKEPVPLTVADPAEAEKRRLDQLEKLRQRDAAGLLDHIGGALAWLALHQAEDGHFGADATVARCKALGHDPCVTNATERYPLAATGLAVLGYLDFRDQDVKRLFEPTLARGIAWLRSQVRKDGSLGASGYPAAIGLMALCQAASSSGSKELRADVDRAMAFYAQHHGPDGGYRYGLDGTKTADQDLSVTGWYVQAVEAARNAGAQVPEAMAPNLVRFLNSVTLSSPNFDRYVYTIGQTNPSGSLAPVGMLCRSILDPEASKAYADAWRTSLTNSPWKNVNAYQLYYTVRMLLALDGKLPETWRKPLTDLAAAQQTKGTTAGMIPLPKDQWFNRGDVGPTIATAFATLTLEHALYRR
jgi:hypothetical protein